MRKVLRTAAFKRDYRRTLRTEHGEHVRETLPQVVGLLAAEQVLPDKYSDHPRRGKDELAR